MTKLTHLTKLQPQSASQIDSLRPLCLRAHMLGSLRQSRMNYWVVALYALAVATLGLAHKPIAPTALTAVKLAAYALPDGTLPDLCLTGHAGSTGQALGDHCDACALSHAPGVVAPLQVSFPVAVANKIAFAIDPAGQFSPSPQRGPAPRGPPASALLTV